MGDQKDQWFPIQTQRGAAPHPLKIPWSVAEKAYSVYAAENGKSQSLEVLAKRGGFGPGEMDIFMPGWREEVSEIASLRSQIIKLAAFKMWVHGYLDSVAVPHHPPGTHGAEGCRIGDRLDWLMKHLKDVEADVPSIVGQPR